MNKRKIILAAALAAGAVLIIIFIVLLLPPTGEGFPGETYPWQDESEFIVCLDPGHGGDAPGALDQSRSRMEKDDNLRLALAVRDILTQEGIAVVMTRDNDTDISLADRCVFADEANASVFVSMHRNSGGGSGIEVWINSRPTAAESKLGQTILDALTALETGRNRGLRTGTPENPFNDFVVIRDTAMPACIIELGFIDSEIDNETFDANLQAYAQAIAGAIASLAPEEEVQ